MGTEKVFLPRKGSDRQKFMIRLLRDVKAMEKMIEDDLFEKSPIRIGAEQEMCLIDENWKPAMLNGEVLKHANNELFTTELAKFNLEMNVKPQLFKDKCLRIIEDEIKQNLEILKTSANSFGADIILTGILPTIRKYDLAEHNLTPLERYRALCKAIIELRGGDWVELKIRGIDELMTKHNSPLMEGCNTGFQVHLQVTPDDFVNKYNIAQAIAGPALGVGTNSPLLFGNRLWHETRIALFQQSIDVRSAGDNLRNRSARVMFGTNWVRNSILDIYKEDITRFRVLLGSTAEAHDPFELLERGEIPNLDALLVHNSTVYRWNRPCFGVTNGKPHLRIENRVLPAGPTVVDEMANAALWLGLVNGLGDHYKDITQQLDFDEAKGNFLAACRNGLNTAFNWTNGRKIKGTELLLKELIPIAGEGLAKANVDPDDIGRYMGILEERCKTGQNGSYWMLKSYSKLIKQTSREEARAAITASIVKQQKNETPVHQWEMASLKDIAGWRPSKLIVEDFMQTDLFTVYEDDVLELVAEIMDWHKLRYVPVENKKGEFVGLITSRLLMRYLLKHYYNADSATRKPLTISEVMIKNPMYVESTAKLIDAMNFMKEHEVGCLPVVNGSDLVGIITEKDYLNVAGRLTYNNTEEEIKRE